MDQAGTRTPVALLKELVGRNMVARSPGREFAFPFGPPSLKRASSLTLPYCWLICFLAYALQQMARELLTNAILANSIGAFIEGWQMSPLSLTISIRAFSLSERAEAFWNTARMLLPLVFGIVPLWLAPRLTTFTARWLALYWALWSLTALLRPLLFSIFFRRYSPSWYGLSPGLAEALSISLVILGLALAWRIFRLGMILGPLGSSTRKFSGRCSTGLYLFSLPILIAVTLNLFWLPYFNLREAWPHFVPAAFALAAFPLLPALWPVAITSPAVMPKQTEILLTFSALVLLLVATPISRRVEHMANEHRLASYWSDHLWISYPSAAVSEASVVAFSKAAEKEYTSIAAKLHFPRESSKIHFIFFSDVEEKLSRVGSSELVDLDPLHDEIRLVFIPPFDHFEPVVLGRFLLQKRFGGGRNLVLETGVADLLISDHQVASVDAPNGTDRELASVLEVEGPASLRDLLYPDHPESLSPFVSQPLGRELANFLRSHFGLDSLLALYSKELSARTADRDIIDALGTSGTQLQADWQQHCNIRRAQFLLRNNQAERQRPATPIPFQKGMSFSAEGGARTGYMSEAACASLDQLRQLHVEWLSLMPFAFSYWSDGQTRLSFSHRNSWEGDNNLRRISWEAHKRGMKIFLKPHLWLRRQSTVDFELSDPKMWRDWFQLYRRYILHQARLAEAIGAELFSVGNELPRLTLDSNHETDWRSLLSEVRRVYSGNVTYCANWGEDFEQIRFADALDVVGLNAYYPLTAESTPSLEECMRGARAVADRVAATASRIQRPIIITEIGYPATTRAALRPWDENSSELSVRAQADAASAFFEAFWNQPWLRGIYWWKWYSHGHGGGEYDASYMPRGKPLAAVISKWYSHPRE